MNPFVVSLSNHERLALRRRLLSPPSTWLRTGFDKLRANGGAASLRINAAYWFECRPQRRPPCARAAERYVACRSLPRFASRDPHAHAWGPSLRAHAATRSRSTPASGRAACGSPLAARTAASLIARGNALGRVSAASGDSRTLDSRSLFARGFPSRCSHRYGFGTEYGAHCVSATWVPAVASLNTRSVPLPRRSRLPLEKRTPDVAGIW